MVKRPEIFIVTGPFAGRSFEVKEGGVHLGRSSACDVQIPDEELSRRHCLLEPSGEKGIRLTDLASANGTILNGTLVGNVPVELKEGDAIEVGKTLLRVGANFANEPTVCVGRVDLGLGESAEQKSAEAAPDARAQRIFRIVLAAVALVVTAGVGIYLFLPAGDRDEQVKKLEAEPPAAERSPELREFDYEYVKADQNGIFRYEMSLSPDGVLSVCLDDVPGENRHLAKNVRLGDEALAELAATLSFDKVKKLDREYIGPEPDPAALESWTLRTVYTTRARSVCVANVAEPEAFRAVREQVETFVKDRLGLWAIMLPRKKLVEQAQRSLDIADQKWNDRDVEYGNLWAAIQAYGDACKYLETVNPSPPCRQSAAEGLARATDELKIRADEQRIKAEFAYNMKRWDEACSAFRVLLEMVPDRADERHRAARAKLIAAEKELRKGAK